MICQHNLMKKVTQVNLTVMKMKQKKNTYWNQRKPWESAAEKRQPADLPSGKTCSKTSTKAVISWNPLKAEQPRSTASCEACPCLIATPSHHSQTQVVQPLMILMHHSVVQVSGSFLLCFVRWLSIHLEFLICWIWMSFYEEDEISFWWLYYFSFCIKKMFSTRKSYP